MEGGIEGLIGIFCKFSLLQNTGNVVKALPPSSHPASLSFLASRGMFTPVEGRPEILSSDPNAPIAPSPPSFRPPIHLWEPREEGGVNLRSRCHFNASRVFSPSERGFGVHAGPLPPRPSLSVFTCCVCCACLRGGGKGCECKYLYEIQYV